MKSHKNIQTILVILFLFMVIPFFRPATAATPPVRRPTPRYIYVYGTPPPVRRLPLRTPSKKKTSLFSEIVQKVGPAVLGSGGLILGAVVAWYTLRRKTKAFDMYFQRIAAAQERYNQTILLEGADKQKALKNLKSELVSIQEEVEMAVAKKKLDQEQLIAVSNKIQRILDK